MDCETTTDYQCNTADREDEKRTQTGFKDHERLL